MQPPNTWSQSGLPHTDIDWRYGIYPPAPGEATRAVPFGLASVFGLTKAFNRTGTALCHQRTTGRALLRTKEDNEELWKDWMAQARYTPID